MPAFQHISVGMQVFFLQAFFYSAFYNIIHFTMTHSVIVNIGISTLVPTIPFVDALEYQKTYCPSKGYKVRRSK